MKRKIFTLFSLILLSISIIQSQPDTNVLLGSRDTLFVYDTLFVMDTIRILRTAKEVENLEKLTPLEISYLDNSFSHQQTATLFHPRINSLNKFKSKNKEMKKLGLLGLVFFAFQNMILAQHNVGVHVGGGVHNLTDVYGNFLRDPSDNTLIRPTIQVGFSCRKLIAKEKLFFDIGLTFSKLRPSRVPAVQKHFDNGILSETGLFTIKETEIFSDEVSLEIRRTYNLVSIPLTFSLNSRFFQPTIGAELYYKEVSSISTSANNGFENTFLFYPPLFRSVGAAALLGFRLPVTKRFNVSLTYVRQLFTNYSFRGLDIASNLEGKMQRLDLAVRYQLLKKKK